MIACILKFKSQNLLIFNSVNWNNLSQVAEFRVYFHPVGIDDPSFFVLCLVFDIQFYAIKNEKPRHIA